MAKKSLRIVAPLPHAPTAPNAPAVPRADTLRRGFTIPEINPPAAKTDDADFLARYAAWQQTYPAGSLPEYVVWEYLVNQKNWNPGGEFVYQAPILGGKTQYGGFVADYFIRPGNMVWNVQGLRYHLTNSRDRAQDLVVKAILSQRGYKVIFLWEDDLLERADYIIQAALAGQESNRHKDDVGLYG